MRIHSFIDYFNKLLTILGLSLYSGMCNFFFITSFFFHFCTCLYYGMPRFRGVITGYFAKSGENILSEYKVENTTIAQYIETAWRSMGILLSAKREMRLYSSLEHKITCVVYLVAGKMLMLVLGVIFINQVLRNYELATKYREVLDQLNEFMTHKKLTAGTRQRLLAFYEYKFQGKFVKESKIQNILSDRLKKEINFYNSNKLVKQVEMFQDIPTKILAEILSNLKVEVFLPNDIIIKSGTPVESMYFLSNGTVCVTTASGREVCHLRDGNYFGEASLVLNHKKSISNVTALEICETYRLDAKTFKHCFKNNPEILNKLRAVAERRERETTQLEKEFQEKLFLKTFLVEKRRATYDSAKIQDGASSHVI
ncbi:hypothetical protein HHI36_015205 [Cryptolaemus montrouzieri]|uniref:Cyclic nucleotide-binding domain-containing protein n=1 Tax=Cryptolaemus montrouzieri TaxID=559131 RepID=A0ABD2N4W7_9CUCU